jgi:hypothetical protein
VQLLRWLVRVVEIELAAGYDAVYYSRIAISYRELLYGTTQYYDGWAPQGCVPLKRRTLCASLLPGNREVNLMEFFEGVSFSMVVWLLPVAIALHELEEWNMLGWYHGNFVDLPDMTNTSTRVFIVFMSLYAFAWTAVSLLLGDLKVTSFLLSITGFVFLLNALQHVYWVIAFRDYAPGVITSVLLVIPVIVFLGLVAGHQGLLPIWYEVLLCVLVIPALAQTAMAGNRLTKMLQGISRSGLLMARLLRLEGR